MIYTKENTAADFKKFAKSKLNIPETTTDAIIKDIATIKGYTPYILEEREMRATLMDVFSRLLMERIIFIRGVVSDEMSDIVQAQLLYLDSLSDQDIIFYINSPGGSVQSGLNIVSTMEYIKSDIATCNIGMAASMGSVLLGAGKKGKRTMLKYSKTMLHQSSGGFGGNIQDAEIDYVEWKKVNDLLFSLLGDYCGKKPEQVKKDASRDLWLDAEESKKYGIIDSILKTRKK
jgi:ATP-dependent Clp protease protease subunit